jgi:hypothetical protein
MPKDLFYIILKEYRGVGKAYNTYYKLFITLVRYNKGGLLLVLGVDFLLKEAFSYIKDRKHC